MTEELSVRIVQLDGMHVASAHGFGAEPEMIAVGKITGWAADQGLQQPRFFGFNNPDPHPGSPNYGYEAWVQVAEPGSAEEGITYKEFTGGLYAVTRAQGVEEIYPTWGRLVTWCEGSPYVMAEHQWLEEHFYEDGKYEYPVYIDLYLPVREG